LDIIFAGAGEFGVPTLRALLDAGHRIVRVISQPDRPAGRGKHVTPTPVSALASERGLSLVRTDDINQEPLPPADVLLVIAFGQKVAPHVVNHPRLGSINLHASLLPKYRGAAPINWAIIRGETLTGNSVIRVAPKMDAGAILAQSELPIGELETAGELHERLAADGAPLVLRTLDALAGGAAIETAQDDALATTAPKLSRESARINWSRPASHIARQIRGMYPWPGCRAKLISPAGQELSRLTLVCARALQASAQAMPGQILPDATIATALLGALEIVELQPEGKRPMSLAAYRNGHPWEHGSRLESV
jgi:methionyl-tRNA formyltransferase